MDISIPLVGPSNPGIHPKADCQRTINLYPVRAEAEGEKVRWHLVGTPGLALFAALDHAPVRGLYVFRGRLFAVAGAYLVEVYPDGSTRQWGAIGSVRERVSMAELEQLGVALWTLDDVPDYAIEGFVGYAAPLAAPRFGKGDEFPPNDRAFALARLRELTNDGRTGVGKAEYF